MCGLAARRVPLPLPIGPRSRGRSCCRRIAVRRLLTTAFPAIAVMRGHGVAVAPLTASGQGLSDELMSHGFVFNSAVARPAADCDFLAGAYVAGGRTDRGSTREFASAGTAAVAALLRSPCSACEEVARLIVGAMNSQPPEQALAPFATVKDAVVANALPEIFLLAAGNLLAIRARRGGRCRNIVRARLDASNAVLRSLWIDERPRCREFALGASALETRHRPSAGKIPRSCRRPAIFVVEIAGRSALSSSPRPDA